MKIKSKSPEEKVFRGRNGLRPPLRRTSTKLLSEQGKLLSEFLFHHNFRQSWDPETVCLSALEARIRGRNCIKNMPHGGVLPYPWKGSKGFPTKDLHVWPWLRALKVLARRKQKGCLSWSSFLGKRLAILVFTRVPIDASNNNGGGTSPSKEQGGNPPSFGRDIYPGNAVLLPLGESQLFPNWEKGRNIYINKSPTRII